MMMNAFLVTGQKIYMLEVNSQTIIILMDQSLYWILHRMMDLTAEGIFV